MSGDLKGMVGVVTGASSGLGKGTAAILARRGATVVLLARDTERGRIAYRELCERSPEGAVDWIPADLESLESVRRFAETFRARHGALHVLCECAGVLGARRETTRDGLERMFQVNYLSHFLLANLLFEPLSRAPGSRVVIVSGSGHRATLREGLRRGTIDFDDLQGERRFSLQKAAKQSVLARLLLAYELSRRWAGAGIAACTLCPGLTRSDLGSGLPPFLRGLLRLRYVLERAQSLEEGASHIVRLASGSDSAEINGKYYEGSRRGLREARSSVESYDLEVARRLWDESERLVARSLTEAG
jgi:NAD(P)-dependent dehydrogenase (short-subunit alcohol dehydrogenase family)